MYVHFFFQFLSNKEPNNQIAVADKDGKNLFSISSNFCEFLAYERLAYVNRQWSLSIEKIVTSMLVASTIRRRYTTFDISIPSARVQLSF